MPGYCGRVVCGVCGCARTQTHTCHLRREHTQHVTECKQAALCSQGSSAVHADSVWDGFPFTYAVTDVLLCVTCITMFGVMLLCA